METSQYDRSDHNDSTKVTLLVDIALGGMVPGVVEVEVGNSNSDGKTVLTESTS